MTSLACSASQCLISIMARIIPSDQRLRGPENVELLCLSELKGNSRSSGGENNFRWPPNMMRNRVDPERAVHNMNIACGFLSFGPPDCDLVWPIAAYPFNAVIVSLT